MNFYFMFIKFTAAVIVDNCNLIKTGTVVAIYYQTWCRFCKAYDETLVKVAFNAQMKNIPLTVQKIDCGSCDCNLANIGSYPTTIIYKNGFEVERKTGKMECKDLGSLIERHLYHNVGMLSKESISYMTIPVTANVQHVQTVSNVLANTNHI